MRKPLTFANKVGYGMGAFTENSVQNGVITMVMFIMYNHMGVSMVKLGYVFGLSRLWDAISDPLMGYISDNTRSRFGKRKPYLVFGAVMTALAYIGMWLFPEGKSEMWYFYYLTIFLLLYFTATTIFCVPYIGMGLEMSSDYHERTRLMGYRSLFVNISSLLLPWMANFTTLRCFASPLEGIRALSLICGACWILFALGATVLTPTFSSRPEDGDGVAANPAAVVKAGPKDVLTAFAVRPFLLLALTLGFTVFGLFLINTTGYNIIIYYVCRGDMALGTKIMGLGGTTSAICGILAIPLVGFMAKRLGKSRAMAFFLGVSGLGNLSLLVLLTPSRPYLAVAQPILGAVGISAMWILINAMTSDVCDWDELHNRRRREGVFAAIISWTCKLGYSLCSVGAGYLLIWSGFDLGLGAEQADGAYLYMRLFKALIPTAGLVVAIVLMLKYPLTPERVEEVKKRLLERHAARSGPSA